MLSPLETAMSVLVLALVAVVITIAVFLTAPGAFLVAVMGAFALACLAGALGLGGDQ